MWNKIRSVKCRGDKKRAAGKKWAAVGAAATFKIAYEKFFFQQRISSL
jgi:hypothetical protein